MQMPSLVGRTPPMAPRSMPLIRLITRVAAAIFDELKGANHRSIFVAHRSGRVVLVHGNDFVGVFDGQIETVCVMFGKLRLDDCCLSNEVNTDTIFASSFYGTQHSLAWSMVSTHCIQGDTDGFTHIRFIPPVHR